MIRKRKRAVVDQAYCVACGCCIKECPVKAIHIVGGMYAKVDNEKCVGCSKCKKACPASVIHMEDYEI